MIKQNLTLGTTTSKKKKNNGTGGLYGDFIGGTGSANNVSLPNLPSSNPTYGDFINIPTLSKDKTGGAYTGNDLTLKPSTPSFGYGDALGDLSVTPKRKDEQIVTPTWGTGNNSKLPPSAPSGISKGDISVAPVDKSQFFDSNVVGTVGGGFSGAKKGGITDEGEIIGNPSVDNSTFNKGNNTVPSGKLPASKSDKIPTPTIEEPVIKPSVDTIKDGSTGGKTPTPSTPAAPTTPKGKKENGSKMSYEDYINEMKKGYQEQLDAANKQAEQTKARAMANAENAYAQNKATYGTNAETLAQMGLTGGGYSDYLQAQAYAQKRADAQAATAQEIASKSNNQATYQQYIQAMNEKLADKILYDERLADQRKYQEEQTKAESDREYTKNIYNTLWSAVQDTNTTYTPESIKALGEKAGLSNEDITTLTNMLNATLARKTEEEKKTQEEEEKVKNEAFAKSSSAVAADTISYIVANNGGQSEYIESLKSNLTEEDYNKLVSQNQKSTSEYYTTAIKSGYNVNTNEIDNMYKKGNLSEAQYNEIKALWNESSIATDNSAFADGNGYTLSFNDAKTVMNTAESSQWINDANKKAIESTYMRLYAKDIANEIMVKSSAKGKGGNVVDIYASDFNTKKFGSYSGMGKSGNTQEKYAQSIVSDAKSGKIKAGDYVIMNFGNTWDVECIYVYIGDGIFVKAKDGNDSTYLSGGKFASGVNFYVPNGYEINFSSNIAFHVDKK